MRQEKKPSKEALRTRYYIRVTKRTIKLVLWLFVLFAIVMAIIWAVPKIVSRALG